MSQRILDEREHRRGLVLGLTLAEVLILLLFLLLLALGTRIGQLQREVHAAQDERDQHKADLDILKATLPADVNVDEFTALKAENANLKNQLQAVRPALDAAARIDPREPPAELLKRGIEALTPEQIRVLSQMSKVTTASIGSKGNKSKDEHDWPPIIILDEATGYFFESGSAELSAAFQTKLRTSVVDRVLEIIGKYKVDVIEVVGHTDEQRFNVRPTKPDTPSGSSSTSRPVSALIGRRSNLDTALIPFLHGKAESQRLLPSDNAGLGLARAASVVRVLLADERLRAYRILPLSGGQLIEVGDRLSTGSSPGDVKERRRIEVRARRSDKSAQSWESRVSQDAPLTPTR